MSTNDHEPQSPSPYSGAGQDTWNSPLWGSPDTVGGYWADQTPVVEPPAPTYVPAAPRSRTPKILAGVAAAVVAAMIAFGVVSAWPHHDGTVTALPPSSSAQQTPGTTPTQDPNAQDPNAQDPNAQDPNAQDPNAQDPNAQNGGDGLPAIPGLPGSGDSGSSGSGASNGSSSGTTTHPAAVAAVSPGIVNITTSVGYDGSEAAGTGEVLTSDGYVLTNHHVIAGSTSIKAAVAGTTKTYSADVVGYDATHDIAVIKLRGATGMTIAPIGDSSTVQVGDTVIGLGNAGGKGGAPIVAEGKVTGLDKSITAMDSENGSSEDLTGLIETDASIAPGDSGGSLVSTEGKVVGIITAGSTSGSGGVSSQTATDGYAVPINQAMAIAQDIRDGKASATIHIGQSGFLGIQVSDTTSSSSGVRIAGTVPGSAAAKSGLIAGDRITAIDGKSVTSNTSLRTALAPHHPGDTISLTWTDSNGASHTASVSLGAGPVS